MTKAQKADRQEAIERLREFLKPGDTVHTILDHVSRSGMSRTIRVVLLRGDDALHPNYLVSRILGLRQAKGDGLVIGGCGMDMGFQLVYLLGSYMFRDGFDCPGKGKCHSNDHVNMGDERDNYSPDKHHRDGGYALKQRWL
jgi:hypothetical protein